MTELNVYGRKDEVARVPEGLDQLLKKFGVTLPDLVGRLAQCPTGVRLEGQNQLDTFIKDQTVIVRRLKLGEAVDVMRLDEDYYLRVKNQQLPESILGAIPGRRLAELIDHDGLTPIKHLPMTNGRAIAEGDLLVQIDWPLVPYARRCRVISTIDQEVGDRAWRRRIFDRRSPRGLPAVRLDPVGAS